MSWQHRAAFEKYEAGVAKAFEKYDAAGAEVVDEMRKETRRWLRWSALAFLVWCIGAVMSAS